jgi:hypothetical protein
MNDGPKGRDRAGDVAALPDIPPKHDTFRSPLHRTMNDLQNRSLCVDLS